MNATWGYEDHTAALRVKGTRGAEMHLENILCSVKAVVVVASTPALVGVRFRHEAGHVPACLAISLTALLKTKAWSAAAPPEAGAKLISVCPGPYSAFGVMIGVVEPVRHPGDEVLVEAVAQ
jgi:hypothetical protein